jgi:hypothetical protein
MRGRQHPMHPVLLGAISASCPVATHLPLAAAAEYNSSPSPLTRRLSMHQLVDKLVAQQNDVSSANQNSLLIIFLCYPAVSSRAANSRGPGGPTGPLCTPFRTSRGPVRTH